MTVARRAVNIPIRSDYHRRARMNGEPAGVSLINILKSACDLYSRNGRRSSAEGLPSRLLTGRKRFDHAGVRNDAPAEANHVVEQAPFTIRAHDSLRKELAASGDKTA